MIWSDTFSKYHFLCLWHSSKGYYSVPCSFRHFLPASPSSPLAVTSTHWGQERSNCVASCITDLDLEHEISLSSTKKTLLFFSFISKKSHQPPHNTLTKLYIQTGTVYSSVCSPLSASHVRISKSIILYSKWMFPTVADRPTSLSWMWREVFNMGSYTDVHPR